jgi:hypothetical protein
MRLIEKIFSKSESNQGPIWPDLEKHQARRKELERTQQIYDEYKQNKLSRGLFTDSSLSNESSHWYDFIKSPWFYIPVATIASCFLIYNYSDVISNWFDRGGGPNNGPNSDLSSNIQSTTNVRHLSRDEALELSRRFRTMEANSSTNQQSIPFLGLSSKYSVNNPQIETPIELIDLRSATSPTGSTSSVETITQHNLNQNH